MPTLTDDLLVRLARIRDRGDENFLTECLAWVLQNDREMLERMIRAILGTERPMPTDLRVETQQVLLDGSIPDIAIRGDDGLCLFVEVKLDAPFDPRQIERYLANVACQGTGYLIPSGTGKLIARSDRRLPR